MTLMAILCGAGVTPERTEYGYDFNNNWNKWLAYSLIWKLQSIQFSLAIIYISLIELT